MTEREHRGPTPLSGASSVEEVARYWDSHSLADHAEATHDVDFEVRAACPRQVTIDPEVYARVAAQARRRGVSPETLVNLWLSEHLRPRRGAERARR